MVECLAAGVTEADQHAAPAQRLQGLGPAVRAPAVDDRVKTARRRPPQARSPIRLRVEDAAAGADLPQTVELCLRRGGHPHLAADRGRDLHGEGRHPTPGTRHQHAAALARARTADRGPPGREPGQAECSRLLPREARRPRCDVLRGHHDLSAKVPSRGEPRISNVSAGTSLPGLPAERRVDHDLISHRDRPDTGADRDDDPGGVGAERHRRDRRGLPPDPPVSPVQCRGDDTNDHIPVTGGRLRHVHLLETRVIPGLTRRIARIALTPPRSRPSAHRRRSSRRPPS